MWATPGVSLSSWMFVCCRECLVSRVASTLAWPLGVLQSAVRPEGGSKKALDNPIWAQGRQRKWLGIPDGGHNQENSCKGLNFNTSVWNSRLLPFSLSRPPPFPSSSSLCSLCLLQIPNRKHNFPNKVGCLANPGFFLVFIIPILWLFTLHKAYLLCLSPFHPPVLFFPLCQPSSNFLSHSFLTGQKKQPTYGYDHPSLSYFWPPRTSPIILTLLLSLFEHTTLREAVWSHIFSSTSEYSAEICWQWTAASIKQIAQCNLMTNGQSPM